MFAVNRCVVTLEGAQKTHDAHRRMQRLLTGSESLPQCGQKESLAYISLLLLLQRRSIFGFTADNCCVILQLYSMYTQDTQRLRLAL